MWTSIQYIASRIQGQGAAWAVEADSWAPGNPGGVLNTTVGFKGRFWGVSTVKTIKNVIKIHTDLRAPIPIAIKVVFCPCFYFCSIVVLSE